MTLVPIGRNHFLNPGAAASFARMNESAKAELGIDLLAHVNVSTRSRKRQQELYDAWVAAGKPSATPVARPGTSEHDESEGRALDINQAADKRILPWLVKHGASFGWYFTAANEKHHISWYPNKPPATRLGRHVKNIANWS